MPMVGHRSLCPWEPRESGSCRKARPLATALVLLVLWGEPLSAIGWLGLALLCAGVSALAKRGTVSTKAWLLALANALVIVTSHLSEKNPFGYNQRSDQAIVTETWRMVNDAKYGRAIDIQVVIDDPVNFVKPSHGHTLFVPGGSEAVLLPYGCTETLWNEYAERRITDLAQSEKRK